MNFTNIIVDPPFSSFPTLCSSFSNDTPVSSVLSHFYSSFFPSQSSSSNNFYWWSSASGKPIPNDKSFLLSPLTFLNFSESPSSYIHIRLNVRLKGGKGGFGSMLRAQGGKMSKKQNKKSKNQNDNFRTIQGRRYKSIRQAKELATYLDLKDSENKSRLLSKKEKLLNYISKSTNNNNNNNDIENNGLQNSSSSLSQPSSSNEDENKIDNRSINTLKRNSKNNITLYDPNFLEDDTTLTNSVKESTTLLIKNLQSTNKDSIQSSSKLKNVPISSHSSLNPFFDEAESLSLEDDSSSGSGDDDSE